MSPPALRWIRDRSWERHFHRSARDSASVMPERQHRTTHKAAGTHAEIGIDVPQSLQSSRLVPWL